MITAQPSHTFLLCSGVNGCINGMIVSVSLANDTPLIRISDGICQSIISIISAISAILTPSVQFNGNRLNSLCFNRTPASIFRLFSIVLPQFYKIYISLPCKFSIIFLAIVSHSCGLLSNVSASKSRTNILYISFFNVSTSVSKVSICASSMLISSYSSEGQWQQVKRSTGSHPSIIAFTFSNASRIKHPLFSHFPASDFPFIFNCSATVL